MMKTGLLATGIGLLGMGIVWAIASELVRAADPPIPVIPLSPSPPTVDPPQPTTISPSPRFGWMRPLFSPLLEPAVQSRPPAPRPSLDNDLQALWQQLAALDANSPQFITQIQAAQPTVAALKRQYQALDDRWGELKALEIELKLHYLACEDEQAMAGAETGFAIAQATGSQLAIEDWTAILASLHWMAGDFDATIALAEQQLATRLATQGRFTFWETYDWLQLGDLYQSRNRKTDAIAAYEQAVASAHIPPYQRDLDVYYAAGSSFKTAAILHLVALSQALDQPDQANYWTQQLAQAAEEDAQFNRAADILATQWSYSWRDTVEPPPFPQQRGRLTVALHLFRQLGDRWGEMDALVELSRVAWLQADYPAAITFGDAAFALATTFQAPRTQAAIVPILVQAHEALGQIREAEAIQQEYERLVTQSPTDTSLRPVFAYGFAIGYTYEILAIAHQQRSCLPAPTAPADNRILAPGRSERDPR